MKYTKIAIFLAVAITLISMVPSFVNAIVTQDNDTTADATATIATQDNGTTAGTVSTIATQDNGSTAGTMSAITTQDNGTTAGTIPAITTQDNGTTAGTVSAITTQDNGTTAGTETVVTPASTGGSSYSSGSRSRIANFGTLPNGTIVNCPLVTTFMSFGANNNSAEVRNLQSFLASTQEVDIDVNGIYDAKTVEAVKAFQTKYADSILAPWGTTVPSGSVRITTSKKINEIACNKAMTLDADELATINAYKNGQVSSSPSGTNEGVNLSNENVVGTATSGPELGTTVNQNENTAAVANIPIFQRFWNFLKSLF